MNRAAPLRAAGAQLIQDLHPDSGPKGTYSGAIISNDNLYCPATPRPLLELGPLARDASDEQTAAHDHQTAETAPTSSARSPPTTQTATTASCAAPPQGNSAARYGPDRCPWTTGDPRSSPRPSTRPRAAPSRRSPCPPGTTPRQRRNTTTPPRPTAGPTRGGPLPSRRSPPPKIPPATASAAAGAASSDSPDRAVRHLPAHHPQPAHPRGLRRAAGPQRPASRRRPAAENPAPAPQDTHQPRSHPAITGQQSPARQRPAALITVTPRPFAAPASAQPGNSLAQRANQRPPQRRQPQVRKLSKPNVKIVPDET